MKQLRVVLWVLVAIVAGGAAYLALNQTGLKPKEEVAQIGGPFDLVTNKGEQITQDDVLGRPHAIFFGFTNCPDICPTTLYETAGWLNQLGDDGDLLDFYFFSVDPARDTPEILDGYVNAFDKRITGVTGDPAKMESAISAYKAYAKKVDLGDGDYTMDHSAFVMLFRPDGSFLGTIAYGENNEMALEKLKRLIKTGNQSS